MAEQVGISDCCKGLETQTPGKAKIILLHNHCNMSVTLGLASKIQQDNVKILLYVISYLSSGGFSRSFSIVSEICLRTEGESSSPRD